MKVLVFGGTQFLGRLLVESLLEAGHEVVLFNRGRTENPFQGRPNLRCVQCDRMGNREHFREVVREEGNSDVVVDFVGFQEPYVRDAVEALTSEVGLKVSGKKQFATKQYIFISSDSVFWAQKVPISDTRISEEDARDFSPEEFDRHLEHCNLTSLGEYQLRYGGNKLSCERVLDEAWRSEGFPSTILRLADAYGPFDNLGGFWELVMAIEQRRPIPSKLSLGRMRTQPGEADSLGAVRRFSWVFAEDARDAILACVEKGPQVLGVTLNVAHEEAVSLEQTVGMIADAMGLDPEALRFDDSREASVPSTDYGCLDICRALRVLRPWRPTPMRLAVRRSVEWFLASREHRRYHRLVHRELRQYDESASRQFSCKIRELPSCWVGAPAKAFFLTNGPVLLNDSLPRITGQAVLGFMQRLMEQLGEQQVACELQRWPEVEIQTWPLRHIAGHLLPQSVHSAAYRLESAELLGKTDLLLELESPVRELEDQQRRLSLHMGGAGARSKLRRSVGESESSRGGFWDCVLLGRRKWRIFPPETPPGVLCAENASESPADCFLCGPDVQAVHRCHAGFAPSECWEVEQTMGDAIVVPDGWWYQSYDDDRTLSISARHGPLRSSAPCAVREEASDWPQVATSLPEAGPFQDDPDDPEVIEFELVD